MVVIKGVEFLNKINFYSVAGKISTIFIVVLAFFFAFVFLYFVFRWVKGRNADHIRIQWFKEVNGKARMIGTDKAREVAIPDTGVKIYYVKKRDLYLARSKYPMGKDLYWYYFLHNHEIVPFGLKEMNIDRHECGLDYDHTDMLYQRENLRKLLVRMYKNKGQPWWKLYAGTISFVILIFVGALAILFILGKMGTLMGSLADIAKNVGILQKSCGGASGVIVK